MQTSPTLTRLTNSITFRPLSKPEIEALRARGGRAALDPEAAW
jgi:hypothetical protein